jgi:hypothetical protein
MWVATQDLPRSAAHPFYTRLNQILDQHDFDGFVEGGATPRAGTGPTRGSRAWGPGCPARELCDASRFQGTGARLSDLARG